MGRWFLPDVQRQFSGGRAAFSAISAGRTGYHMQKKPTNHDQYFTPHAKLTQYGSEAYIQNLKQ